MTIEGFRAFTERVEIDFHSDITILVGPNGAGKTSLLDAILWGLTGHLSRVGDERVLSLYAPSGLARVALTLADGNRRMSVVRTFLGGASTLTFSGQDKTFEGPLADAELVRTLWEAGASSTNPLKDLHEILTRSVYLQQDLVRQFVDRDTPPERFDSIGRLVGVGRIADFERKLANQNRSWAAVMNQRKDDLTDAERRLTDLRSEYSHLSRDIKESDATQLWTAWWNDLLDKGLGVRPIPDVSIPNAPQLLEQMLRSLQSARTSIQRKLSIIPQIRDDIVALTDVLEMPKEEIARLRAAVKRAKDLSDRLREMVNAAEKHDAAARAELMGKKSAEDEMRSLATLALRHLSKHCPVCEQSIDAKVVEARLKRLIGADSPKPLDALAEAPKLLGDLEHASAEFRKAERDLEEATNAQKLSASRRAVLKSQLADLDLEAPSLKALDELAAKLNSQVAHISDAYKSGEALTLAIVRLSEEGKREELARRENEAVKNVESARTVYEEYQAAHKQATRIIEDVRAMADEAVNRQIERIGPLLQKIYTRMDPHPTFRWAKLRSYGAHGRGRVDTEVADRRDNMEVDSPAEIFSSAQTNALAVAIFMAMNLSSERLPLHIAILDDPLQSLDGINLLGLLDVLRRTRERRQLLISTHDQNFAALLSRKFRPLEFGQQTSIVRLRNWERAGVKLEQTIVSEIPARLQVVS